MVQQVAPSTFFEVEPIESLSPTKRTELAFNKYGIVMVLKEVWVAGETRGVVTVTKSA